MASVARRVTAPFIPLIILTLLITFPACRWGELKRPYGYLRLGTIDQFMKDPETFVAEDRLVIRFDGKGFSAMSTQCTHDLSPLVKKTTSTGEVWASEYSTSTYTLDGTVITGPATANLPYYEVRLESGKYGGPKDTLYVAVGDERPKGWQLPIR